MIHGTYMH